MSQQPHILTELPRPELTDASYFDLAAARTALAERRPLAFPPFELVHWAGLNFALNFLDDPIQNALRQGRFYEERELTVLKRMLPLDATYVDIGANIGNHAIFFAKRMRAARVIVFEPNPLALAPLMANIVLNRLEHVIVTDHLGIGLSGRAGDGFGMGRHDRNLGATVLTPETGEIAVRTGDQLLADETPDLIKLDVEGMEMEVLAGLQATIARSRPYMLVEVRDTNSAAFGRWCLKQDYRVTDEWRVGPRNANYLIEPEERR
jgi:FkbM family methyltransferase